MFKNFLLSALRNALKHKFFSGVNLLGLAIGLTACFFVFQYVSYERSFDNFDQAERVYRVGIKYGDEDQYGSAGNHPAVAPTMSAEMPEVEAFTRVFPVRLYLANTNYGFEAKSNIMVSAIDKVDNNNVFKEDNIYVADPGFFQVFSTPFIYGNASDAISKPNTVAISASTAKKYFGSQNPLGKVLSINNDVSLRVNAVFRDVPYNRHLQYDMIMSVLTIGDKWEYDRWVWPEFYNYVLLKPPVDLKKIEAALPGFVQRHMGEIMKTFNLKVSFFVTPVRDIHLKSKAFYEPQPPGNEKAVLLLSIIGGFILLIAWINYVNLLTARSIERTKEVGLRKVVGAGKVHVIMQFVLEAIAMNAFALVAAALFTTISLLIFRNVGDSDWAKFLSYPLWQQPAFWKVLGMAFIAGICVTGIYPALVLSDIKPAFALKGKFSKSLKSITVRKVLVTFQFVLTILLIGGTLTVYRQLRFMLEHEQGYDRDQVLVTYAPAVYDSTMSESFISLSHELLTVPGVRSCSYSSDIPGRALNSFNSVWLSSKQETEAVSSFYMEIDDHFTEAYNIRMAAGRSFRSSDRVPISMAKNAPVIINETLAKMLGYPSDEAAVNQLINMRPDGRQASGIVIGVMKDYNQRSLHEKYDPILYYYPTWNQWKYVSVKLAGASATQSISYMEKKYKDRFPGNSFEYFFLDEYFGKQYATDQQFKNIVGFFTAVALLIACLGLLGLSTLTIQLRTREIGIRKTIGASFYSLWKLFSKEFAWLVLFASIIAVPVLYYLADRWLNDFAFRIKLNIIVLAIPSLSLLFVTLATITMQSLRALLASPVNSLRE